MKKEEMAKVSGGWGIDVTGAYAITVDQVEELKQNGFEVILGHKGEVKGWEKSELGSRWPGDLVTYAVNYNGERATPEQIIYILGMCEFDCRIAQNMFKQYKGDRNES